MIAATYQFSMLKRKYENFAAPTVRIIVDGVDIGEKLKASFSEVSVDLTSDFSASSGSFDLINAYDHESSEFKSSGAARLLCLGAQVEIRLGYIQTLSVFTGLITEVEYVIDGETAPYIHVECLDAKFLLMKQQNLSINLNKSITEAVSALLDARPFSSYILGKDIEPNTVKFPMLPAMNESDYQFIVRWAKYIGYEFFILQGKAILREYPTSNTPIITLASEDKCVSSVRLTLSGASLVSKTTAVGISSEDGKSISGTAMSTGKFGTGAGPSKMLMQSEKIAFDNHLTSVSDAQQKARQMMQISQESFGKLVCTCPCLPELVPGRTVKLKGFSAECDKTFYITSVSHKLNGQGFESTVEARINSL